jgi:hypothetical protein
VTIEDGTPFKDQKAAPLQSRGAAAEIEKTRAVMETMGSIEVALRFPRDQKAAIDRILQACTRPSLAEAALYSYARGGNEITGPSIRMAEAIAQNWGNMQFGIRELEQRHGESTVEAFAWDMQTNTRSSVTFQVPHKRHTRERDYALTDPRDIYELVANMGARRLRSRILAIVPGDIVELAVTQVETTLKTRVNVTPEVIKSLVEKFGAIGVTKQMLEAKIQRHIDSITPALVVQLGKAYNAINDGIGKVDDYFQVAEDPSAKPAEKVKDALRKRTKAPPPDDGSSKPEPPGPASQEPSTADMGERQPDIEKAVVAAMDEKELRLELRDKIARAFENVPNEKRRAILEQRYAKNATFDLTTDQLNDLLDNLPALLA